MKEKLDKLFKDITFLKKLLSKMKKSECPLCREMQSRGVKTKCIGDPHKN